MMHGPTPENRAGPKFHDFAFPLYAYSCPLLLTTSNYVGDNNFGIIRHSDGLFRRFRCRYADGGIVQ